MFSVRFGFTLNSSWMYQPTSKFRRPVVPPTKPRLIVDGTPSRNEANPTPPPLTPDDERHPSRDRRYANIPVAELPLTESLKDTVARFLPYWHGTIAPAILAGQRVLVAAHGNSLRALVKYLDDISEADIVELNIPTGIPLIYELDAQLRPIRSYYLGDAEAARKAAAAVANQASAR